MNARLTPITQRHNRARGRAGQSRHNPPPPPPSSFSHPLSPPSYDAMLFLRHAKTPGPLFLQCVLAHGCKKLNNISVHL